MSIGVPVPPSASWVSAEWRSWQGGAAGGLGEQLLGVLVGQPGVAGGVEVMVCA